MTSRLTRSAVFALLLLVSTAPLLAEWYDDYADGIAAARKGQWQVVVDKMSAAINKKPKEDDKARSYGAVFVAYHPYYYRGAAYFQLGQFQKASDDLNKATGMGEVKLQSLDRLQMDVQTKLAQGNPPPPTNTNPPPTRPVVPTNTAPTLPVQPTIDVAAEQAKQRANTAINQALASHNAAQSANAPTLSGPAFIQATETLGDARTRAASARSAGDWQEVAQLADRARLQFDDSRSQAVAAAAHQTSRPVQATTQILNEPRTKVRNALEDYFNGRYEAASREFQSLASNELPKNALIWSFLGASQYSQYYLGGQQSQSLRSAAEDSFRHARALKRNLIELPKAYFSRRIRSFYKTILELPASKKAPLARSPWLAERRWIGYELLAFELSVAERTIEEIDSPRELAVSLTASTALTTTFGCSLPADGAVLAFRGLARRPAFFFGAGFAATFAAGLAVAFFFAFFAAGFLRAAAFFAAGLLAGFFLAGFFAAFFAGFRAAGFFLAAAFFPDDFFAAFFGAAFFFAAFFGADFFTADFFGADFFADFFEADFFLALGIFRSPVKSVWSPTCRVTARCRVAIAFGV